MKNKIIKIAPYASIIGLLTFIVCCSIAAYYFVSRTGENYSILNHFISELGDTKESPYYILFCIGLSVFGSLNLFLIIGLGYCIDNIFGEWAIKIGLISSVASVVTGFLPADELLIPHLIAALVFFIGSLIAVGLFGVALLKDDRGLISKNLIIPSFITSGIGLTFLLLPNEEVKKFLSYDPDFVRPVFWLNPFFEWLVFFSLSIWIILMSRALYKVRNENFD